MIRFIFISFFFLIFTSVLSANAAAQFGSVGKWPSQHKWPQTDFSQSTVSAREFKSGGPPKDGIPSIDNPKFIAVSQAKYDLKEPVIALEINGDIRAQSGVFERNATYSAPGAAAWCKYEL